MVHTNGRVEKLKTSRVVILTPPLVCTIRFTPLAGEESPCELSRFFGRGVYPYGLPQNDMVNFFNNAQRMKHPDGLRRARADAPVRAFGGVRLDGLSELVFSCCDKFLAFQDCPQYIWQKHIQVVLEKF